MTQGTMTRGTVSLGHKEKDTMTQGTMSPGHNDPGHNDMHPLSTGVEFRQRNSMEGSLDLDLELVGYYFKVFVVS